MKNLLFAITAGCLFFIACKKDDVTEISKTEKLSREWVVVKFEVNGFDQTGVFEALFPEYSVDFNANGTYTEYYLISGTMVPVPGTWVFLNNDTQIQMTDASQIRLYNIVVLSTTNLQVDNADNTDDDFYFLEPKP